MKLSYFQDRNPADVVNILAGLALVLSPWVLGFTTDMAAAWNAWIVGAAVALAALWALVSFHWAEKWVSGALGLWAVVAPWALGFEAVRAAAGAHVVLGLVVLILAAATLWADTNRPHRTS